MTGGTDPERGPARTSPEVRSQKAFLRGALSSRVVSAVAQFSTNFVQATAFRAALALPDVADANDILRFWEQSCTTIFPLVSQQVLPSPERDRR